MIDFLTIRLKYGKRGVTEIYPDFEVKKSSDLMIRAGDFYAIWLEDQQIWSTDKYDCFRLIDNELDKYVEKNANRLEGHYDILYMKNSSSGKVHQFNRYCKEEMIDNFHVLNEKILFQNDTITKKDYASKKLNYALEPCDIPNYERLMSVLYDPEERAKIEWAIGSVVTGESKKLQKFLVLYGAPGTGKSTVLNIIEKLFDGYIANFDAKAMGDSNKDFSLEAFKNNPLVAIQQDGDLSRIEDNTKLNSVVSHDKIVVNEKHKSLYSTRFKCFLFMGTNKPVKISDAQSGLLRRLIDVHPTGNTIPQSEYKRIMNNIEFELGGIACHCRDVYLSDPGKYDDYRAIGMMDASNDFYNFMSDSFFTFKDNDETTSKEAWEMYKAYCDDAKVSYPLPLRAFKEELKNYFDIYEERSVTSSGLRVRSYYKGFKVGMFTKKKTTKPKTEEPLLMFAEQPSRFDEYCKNLPAQYATKDETPSYKWDKVKTTLHDIDTHRLHYVKIPENHIVIDFDIPNEEGKKDFKLNLKEASKWPPTYAELSKSGAGIHLHYIYTGDVSKLSSLYAEHIEVKVFKGNSSLRRKLTKCNDIPIATISAGLPLKGEKNKVVNFTAIENEKQLRNLVLRYMDKSVEVKGFGNSTSDRIRFISQKLEDVYASGMHYDISDLQGPLRTFAMSSTHQKQNCMNIVAKMKVKSDEPSEPVNNDNKPIVFYDVEVFPNLLLINWKYAEDYSPKDFPTWEDYVHELLHNHKPINRMVNPSPVEVSALFDMRLVGYNCRRYDNHIIYARLQGYSNEQLFHLSKRIVDGERNAFFGEAYNASYTDIYDYASIKQSLKKWEIQLGLEHKELGLPWDQPVPEELWEAVSSYCDNDVISTEATWQATQADFTARKILAELADGSVNDTTNSLTTKIIFGKERNPKLVYTHLDTGEQE